VPKRRKLNAVDRKKSKDASKKRKRSVREENRIRWIA